MGVVGDIPIKVRLARLSGGKLHHIHVGLDQGNAPAQVEELLPACHPFRIKTAGVNKDLNPLIRRKLLPLLNELVQN